MKNIKKMMATMMMMAVLMVGTTFAGEGILVNGLSGSDNCSQTVSKDGIILSDFTGILVNGFTGILVNGFTGILVNGLNREQSQCRGGIILSD